MTTQTQVDDLDNIISIRGLTKYYGTQVGVDNLDLDIRRGEIFGYLGQNGAGKTTTIRCLLNILIPDSGNMTVDGKEVSRDTLEIRDGIGYLPGELNVPTNYNVKDFIDYMASLRKTAPVRMQEMIGKFNLPLEKKVHQLSKGNKQKVGIILAFMNDPELLILDEPTAGLDPILQQEMYDLILEEKRKGKTVFFSSHNLDEVQRICDRVGIIRDGELVSVEDVSSLAEQVPRRLKAWLGNIDESILSSLGDLVKKVDAESQVVEIEVGLDTSLSEVLGTLAKMDLRDLSYPQASLEEFFLSKYATSAISSDLEA